MNAGMKSDAEKSSSFNRLFWAVVILVVILNLSVIGYAFTNLRAATSNTNPARVDISGGVPVQRARIDHFFEQVASYRDFEALCEGLNDDVATGDGVDIVLLAGAYSSDMVPQTTFSCVLADRRVARLYSMLAQMSKRDAERRVLELFRNNLRNFKSWRESVIQLFLETEGKGKRAELPNKHPDRARHHALAATCFLAATYTSASRLCEMFDDWKSCADELILRLNENKEYLEVLKPSFEADGAPQNLFMVNCFVLYLDSHRCLSENYLERVADGRMSNHFFKQSYLQWDAETIPQDFTHIHRFVPTDEAKKIRDLRVATDWAGLQFDQEQQKGIVEEFRSLAKKCR